MDKQDELKFAVILTERVYPEPPYVAEEKWQECNQYEGPKWTAVLTAEEFAELCEALCLTPECSTLGSGGPEGFEAEQGVPAYAFHDGNGEYDCWVTPFTERVKAAALEKMGPVEDVPMVTDIDNTAGVRVENIRVGWVPLWGEDWPRVEEILDQHFKDPFDGEPLREIDLSCPAVATDN